ncbi:MAG: PKD domain-containing protein [Bacteroidetes bacterium]|nr:MAG: PKD domain-containing protein [Bacteroidota bacterium]
MTKELPCQIDDAVVFADFIIFVFGKDMVD